MSGKIARLPLALREELNRRLQDGEKGSRLLAWLNGLPEVQAILASEFKGQPITDANFSRWKLGGYQSWLMEQNAREGVLALMESMPANREVAKEYLSDRMAFFVSVRLALEMHEMDLKKGGAGNEARWDQLVKRFLVMRRDEIQTERLRLQQQKIDRKRERSKTTNSPASPAQSG